MFDLRPYQQRDVDIIRDHLRKGVKSMVRVLPTGGGKTVEFGYIAKGAASRSTRVLILVHRREIMSQTLKKLFGFGVTAGQIATGHPMTRDPIQVAMIHTLRNRLDVVKRPDLIIVDEGHHVTDDNTWGRVLRYWGEVPRILFTATPERLDGRGLRDAGVEEMVLGPSMAELVEGGYLAMPIMYKPAQETAFEYHVKRGDYDTKEQHEQMSKRAVVGDVIEHYRKHMDGWPAICACVSVEHARLMARQFEAAGYRARAVWGNMDTAQRESALNGLADGSVQIVTFCDLIGEGVDIPAIGGAILLRRTMSLSLYLQIAGRALRMAPGKTHSKILDHVGNYYLHGHVLADRQWSLDSGRRDPRRETPPTTTTCPRCYGIWPGTPRRCPSCGFEFKVMPDREFKPLRVIAGELVEAGLPQGTADDIAAFVARTQAMTPKDRQRATMGKAYEMAMAGGGRTEVDALRKAIGYKPGWTRFVWEEVLKKRG